MYLKSEVMEKVKSFLEKGDTDIIRPEELGGVDFLVKHFVAFGKKKRRDEFVDPRQVLDDMGFRKPDFLRLTESPIEESLLLALNTKTLTAGSAMPQVEIGPYRIDIGFREVKLAVECDGREYHASPAQIQKDQRRDEYLQNLGWTVIRFTGFQIHHDLWECVDDITKVYEGLLKIGKKKEPWE